MTLSREAIAQIIAPSAFYRKRKGRLNGDVNPADRFHNRERALAKADQIIALTSPSRGGGRMSLAPDRIALDFRTDMTRASAPVLRLGVIVSVPGGWDYAWKRDRLEPDEVALCNLATWPELGTPLAPFLQRVIEEFADDVYGSFGKWSLYSAFQLVDLSGENQPPGTDITTDGPHTITDVRRWLARQLMDSRLSDKEAFGIVRHHPDISPSREEGLREALDRAIKAMVSVHLFVNSRERTKQPEGRDWYDDEIEAARTALRHAGGGE